MAMKHASKDERPRERARTAPRMARLLALVLLFSGLPLLPLPEAKAQSNFNYAEALQKSIWFYEVQVAGPKPPWSRVTWRGPSALEDGSDVGRDLTGGWFDAGDHIKFGYAMASSATMLAWSGVEYRAAYEAKGQLPHLLNNLRVATDYFIKAHTAPNELYGQIGEEGPDHSFWGPAEIMQMQRRAFKIDMSCRGSDLAAETAAALAAASIVFRPTDAAYANTLVSHARQLFSFAEATFPSFYSDCIPAQCCYNSRSGNADTAAIDEQTWAAVWLFKATNEAAFLTRARALYPTMCKESQSSTPCFTWTQGWNDKNFGTYVLMAKLTGEQVFLTDSQRWLDHWSVGAGLRTTGGLMFVHGFGSLRYATNTAFIALVYADFLGTSNPLYSRYHDFAKRQIDYVLGSNPANHSYMCGFGNNPPINPHHRTAHGSWINGGTGGVPTNNRHVLYGAMVGGPISANDFDWSDDRGNFMKNEVATDFNAGLTGALARLAQEFGGNPLANFPPVETPDDAEMFIEAGINVQGSNFTEIRAFVSNRSAWPARMLDQGTFRYFFTLDGTTTPSQIAINQNFSQCTGVSGPTQFSGNIYYVQVNCVGTEIFPGGQSEHRKEVQFRITSSGTWDTSNDYSFQGLTSTAARTQRIVLYDAGTRVWGTEPGPPMPDFSLSATPPAVTVNRTQSATTTIGITRINGFASGVTFSATGLPTGVTFSFNPLTTSTTGTSSILTFSANATATLGPATVTVTGTGGGLSRTTTVNLTVGQVQNPDFSLSAAPPSLTVKRTQSGTSTIGITRLNGFASAVTFSATGLPTGVTATFNPVTTTTTGTSSILTLAANATATLGPATVTVTGMGGGLSRTTTINLTVGQIQTPDFSLSATPPSLTVNRTQSGTSTIGITRLNGFASAVTFSATGLPTGVTATFNPVTTTTTGTSSILTLAANATATLGPATVTVTGMGGGLSRTTTINLTVGQIQNPDFSLSATPPSLTVNRTQSGTSTIGITRLNGFASTVAFSATGLPTGVTATFNPMTTTTTGTSSILTLAANATATLGPATVTVTGSGGGLSRTTTIALTVNDGGGTGGVTVTPVVTSSSPWFNEQQIRITNTASITAMSITVTIQRTAGLGVNGQYNTVGSQIQQSVASTTATLTYQFSLVAGQTLSPTTNARTFAAQTSGNGTAHPTAGDTWVVTYTTGGANFTQQGTF